MRYVVKLELSGLAVELALGITEGMWSGIPEQLGKWWYQRRWGGLWGYSGGELEVWFGIY